MCAGLGRSNTTYIFFKSRLVPGSREKKLFLTCPVSCGPTFRSLISEVERISESEQCRGLTRAAN